MKMAWEPIRCTLGVCAVSVVLAGCGGSQLSLGSQLPIGSQPPLLREATVKEKVIYGFGSPPDGGSPYAGLINVGGTLYGTTHNGGTNGRGTVFQITPSGGESVLYAGFGHPDGVYPYARLIEVNGILYGTTQYGGAYNGGTVFQVTTSGAENILHNFGQGDRHGTPTDGYVALDSLINVGGTLYGTTYGGGVSACSPYGCGTIFGITTSGVESVIYRFAGGTDGSNPTAGLIEVNGTFYGTTHYGGGGTGSNCNNPQLGCGTIFQITPSGGESILHHFTGGTDGANPNSDLINVNGTLYGTTIFGGANGYGTVFQITTSGAYSQLYSFAGGADGALPYAGLINVGGTLYGTTHSGGGSGCHDMRQGCGTVFQITPSGGESVLYSFAPPHGTAPIASLIDVNGKLYGTTSAGGSNNRGTVFSLSL